MIFNKILAKKLEVLVNHEVEQAIILLLDHVLSEKELLNEDPTVTDAQLRQLQGQKILIKELKQYRTRLKDTITRENERDLNGGHN